MILQAVCGPYSTSVRGLKLGGRIGVRCSAEGVRPQACEALRLAARSDEALSLAGAAAYAVLRSSCDAGQALKHLEQQHGGRLQHLLLKALQRYAALKLCMRP